MSPSWTIKIGLLGRLELPLLRMRRSPDRRAATLWKLDWKTTLPCMHVCRVTQTYFLTASDRLFSLKCSKLKLDNMMKTEKKCLWSNTGTLSHLKSFLEPAVPPIRLFLMINMMPLKRCVVKGNYFIALLRNEARNKFLMSGPWLSVAKLRPLSFAAARWRCLYFLLYSYNFKFPRQSWK